MTYNIYDLTADELKVIEEVTERKINNGTQRSS